MKMKINKKIKNKLILCAVLAFLLFVLCVLVFKDYTVQYCYEGQKLVEYKTKLFSYEVIDPQFEKQLYDHIDYDASGNIEDYGWAFEFYLNNEKIEDIHHVLILHSIQIDLVPVDRIYYVKKEGTLQVLGSVNTLEELYHLNTPDYGDRKFSCWTYYGNRMFTGLKDYGVNAIPIGELYTASYECLLVLSDEEEISRTLVDYGKAIDMPDYKEGYALLGWLNEDKEVYKKNNGIIEFAEKIDFADFTKAIEDDMRLYVCAIPCEDISLVERKYGYLSKVNEIVLSTGAKLDFNMDTYLLLQPEGSLVEMANYGKMSGCIFESEDEDIAKVEENVVKGCKAGETVLKIHFGQYVIEVPLKVEVAL